jgi:hypothetical protein
LASAVAPQRPSKNPERFMLKTPESGLNGVRNLLTHQFFGFEGQQKIKNGDF